ncbi:alkaline phosphatase family protein [Myxococcota bacterium]|nr:alkaline phosphatase family protein [Myxococcota bacterium]MBU1535349.1 alkaline phosphatase family protein [Myxococcota bacterium]
MSIFPKHRAFSLTLLLWTFLFTFSIALFVDDSMRNRQLEPHPYVLKAKTNLEKLRESPKKSDSRLFVYFIDCLRFDYAINPAKMPYLHSLLTEGTWGRVNPCLTNMTVHCVEATFSGQDRSSILSFSEDFHPRASKNKKSWIFQMAARDHKITVVGDHVFKTLYGDVLYKMHEYQKGASQQKLTDLALKWFEDPSVSVSIVHLLGPHDDGQAFGSVSPQYHKQLKEVDDILRHVVKHLKPNDSLLVYGDHGINDVGQHTYNTDTPTFYLYKGPKFAKNKRFDIDIASHAFWLSTLFDIPLEESYQGEVYWGGLTPEAKKPYGTPNLFSLKREKSQAKVKLKPLQITILITLFILVFMGLFLRFDGIRHIPWWTWPLSLLPLTALFLLDKFWLLPFVLALPSVFLFRRRPSRGAMLFGGTVVLLALLKAALYQPVDLLIHDAKIYFVYSLYIVEAILCMIIARRVARSKPLSFQGGLAALFYGVLLLILHYPTLYFYGVIRGVPFFLILILSGFTISTLTDGSLKHTMKERLLLGGLLLVSVGFLSTQISMFVENFRIFYFNYIPKDRSIVHMVWGFSPFFVATALLARLAKLKGALPWTILGLTAIASSILAMDIIPLPPLFFLGLFVVILALWFIPFTAVGAFPKHLVLWLIMFPELAYMHQFHPGHVFQITGLCMTAGLLNMVIKDNGELERWKLAIPYILMGLLVLVVAFGFRTNGIDYKFAIKWFPLHFEKLWALIFAADMIKYFMGILFISLFFPVRALPIFRLAANFLITLQFFLGTFLLWLFLVQKKIPLVVDSLEETVYMMGFIFFTGLLILIYPLIKPRSRA